MEPSNVNNLNGVPNFGHGLPSEVEPNGEVLNETTMTNEEENVQDGGHEENVPADEAKAEEDNGQ